MKYIKKYEIVEDIKEKYEKGDYIIFNKNKHKFNNAKNNIIVNTGKPYEIINITDNEFERSVVIYDDNGEKRPISFFDNTMKKIPKETALMLLAKQKYNI